MLKRLVEVEGRGAAMFTVILGRNIRWVGTSDLNQAEVTHRVGRTLPNLIEAFSKGKNARLDAEVVRSSAKGKWKGQKNKILLDGSVTDSS